MAVVPNPWNLSPRQVEAMDLLVEVGDLAEVAKRMGLLYKGVERHMLDISIKMGMRYRNRVQRIVAWDRFRREGAK